VLPQTGFERLPLTQAVLDQAASSPIKACPLSRGQEAEALDFLAAEPLRNVYMLGIIRDNGLVSPLNRGAFYACRDEAGQIEGVALIGHVTQLDVRTERAMKSFASAAQTCPSVHVVMGESKSVSEFWRHYSAGGQELRVACRELLLEQQLPIEACGAAPRLRQADVADLPQILRVQAAMAVAECGVNPLTADPEGFRARCVRRIERGRIWVLVEGGKLLFKADIMAETPEAIYIEGVYVNRRYRQRGHGRRCLLELGQILLSRSKSVCLLVNERNLVAQSFYNSVGYKLRGLYDTIYLYKEKQLSQDD
jgi:ribosomal protein S18 acetylase RimI-like enzyme